MLLASCRFCQRASNRRRDAIGRLCNLKCRTKCSLWTSIEEWAPQTRAKQIGDRFDAVRSFVSGFRFVSFSFALVLLEKHANMSIKLPLDADLFIDHPHLLHLTHRFRIYGKPIDSQWRQSLKLMRATHKICKFIGSILAGKRNVDNQKLTSSGSSNARKLIYKYNI